MPRDEGHVYDRLNGCEAAVDAAAASAGGARVGLPDRRNDLGRRRELLAYSP